MLSQQLKVLLQRSKIAEKFYGPLIISIVITYYFKLNIEPKNDGEPKILNLL